MVELYMTGIRVFTEIILLIIFYIHIERCMIIICIISDNLLLSIKKYLIKN